ncbi:hypothetical protein OHA21_43885 [Actinoplanes sp. NBC_00393]|uniref:hypothetical protein n=1 Tax=Actinoplanes sp. NBC_00393 TaxID=2975953 RepID=UPI002E1AD6F8
MVHVPYGAQLDTRQRMGVAKVSGHAEWLIQGQGWPVDEQTVAELHAITRDPVVYGIALGNLLGRMETAPEMWAHLEPMAELYRQCGADLEVADRQRQWRASRLWTT